MEEGIMKKELGMAIFAFCKVFFVQSKSPHAHNTISTNLGETLQIISLEFTI